MKCTECKGIIIADTEDWNFPLCPDHYFEHLKKENEKLEHCLKLIISQGGTDTLNNGKMENIAERTLREIE